MDKRLKIKLQEMVRSLLNSGFGINEILEFTSIPFSFEVKGDRINIIENKESSF